MYHVLNVDATLTVKQYNLASQLYLMSSLWHQPLMMYQSSYN